MIFNRSSHKKAEPVFERFTDTARHAILKAQDEARRLNNDCIGTEHILLGLITYGEGTAIAVLNSFDFDLEAAKSQVEEIAGKGAGSSPAHIPFTPRSKKVLDLAVRESHNFSHSSVGTEHILLGLVREQRGVGAEVIMHQGVALPQLRQRVIDILSREPEEP